MKKLNKVICSVLLCGAFFMPVLSVSAEKAPAVTTVTSSEVVSTEELPVTSITESENSDDTAETTDISETDNSEEDKTASDETSSLPEGNGALLEDVSDDVVNRQFLSIQSKNGNTFYIVIDKDSKGKQNVYFMNLVDEYDLMAFAEKFPEEVQSELKDGTESSAETDKDGNSVKSDENQTDKDTKTKSSSGNPILIIILVLAAGGGGAFYYFKVVKPKKGAKAPKQADYGDEDEDYEEDTVNEDVSDEDEEV